MTEPTTYILLIDDDEDDLEMISAGHGKIKGILVSFFYDGGCGLSSRLTINGHILKKMFSGYVALKR